MIEHQKIKHIIELSNKLGNNQNKIIEMMQHHASEIKDLYNNKNKHLAIETGDLIMLSLQLLRMEGYSAESIMNECYKRFDKKLNELIKNKNVN